MSDSHDPENSHTTIDPLSLTGFNEDIPEDPRIVEVVQDYLAQLEQGQTPDRAAFMRRYPELAGAIDDCLEGLDLIHSETKRQRPRSASGRAVSATAAQADPLPDPLGDFRIVRELARGGMGVVYEAVQLSLGRRVALKVLPFASTLDARHLQRFKTEAQAAALLHHTNIVPVFAVGCERGVHFYAMQLIEGQSLAALIGQLRRQSGLRSPEDVPQAGSLHSSYVLGDLPAESSAASRLGTHQKPASPVPETASKYHAELSTQHAGRDSRFFKTTARLMWQAAQALEHAHEFGIVHRDIKPANLLLDMYGVLWVADFGLAQFHADAGLTRTGDIPGTLRYMSPEQASGRKAVLDRRTDVYSLGATFYELLTLEPIFKGRDAQYLLQQILHNEPRGLRQLDKTIPVELETIVLKSLSKNPDDRYRSAGELAADLQRYLDNKPILARRPSLIDRGRKWSRRHPSVVVASILVLTVVTAGLLVSNHREKLRADEAEHRFQQARQVVDVLIEVGEDDLADNPRAQETRQRLLGIALSYYQDFIEQRRGDAAGQAELERVQERVKGILHELTVLQRDMQRGALEKEAVQEALKLSDEQHEQLTALLKKWKQDGDANWRIIWSLPEDERRRRLVAIAEEHDRALDGALSASQRQRLTEITTQNAGIFAFKNPDLARSLKLTTEQRKAIREIERDTWRRSFVTTGTDRGPEPPPRPTKRESIDSVLAVLTEEQIQKWRELTGISYAGLDEPQFGGRPQGFGPPLGDRGRRGGRHEKRSQPEENPSAASQ